MKNRIEVEISDRTLNRIRNYVAREARVGRHTTVAEVVERALATIEDVRKARSTPSDK